MLIDFILDLDTLLQFHGVLSAKLLVKFGCLELRIVYMILKLCPLVLIDDCKLKSVLFHSYKALLDTLFFFLVYRLRGLRYIRLSG